ncbi:MAG: sigma-70 family RNA polymerase sigma factor [Spartobacteria bacterium]
MMEEREQRRIFDEWLGCYRGLLFKVVHAYGFTSHDRDDLFQEIATQVWNSIPRFRAESSVTTWLYRVALNSALAWSRKERKHRDQTEPFAGQEPALRETARAKDPRLGWLYEQIAQLDHVDRSLTLLLLDGFSYREMAETLGISESYVGVKINRIKNHLKSLTKEELTHGV